MKKILYLLILLSSYAIGQVPDPKPNTYVNDLAGVLSPGEVQVINDTLLAIERRTSVQIAVVLVERLPDGMEIDQYAQQIGRKWHVGNAKNGLVYVAAIEQRRQRLEVANNLEGDIPDAIALRITDRAKPYFRQGSYGPGVQAVLEGIKERVDPVAKEQLRLAEGEAGKRSPTGAGIIIFFSVLMAAIAGVMIYSFWRVTRKEDEPPQCIPGTGDTDLNRTHSSYKPRRYEPRQYIAPAQENYPPAPDPPAVSSPSYSSPDPTPDPPSSDYGDWGSGSSDNSSSSDSGYSGGGASNDW